MNPLERIKSQTNIKLRALRWLYGKRQLLEFLSGGVANKVPRNGIYEIASIKHSATKKQSIARPKNFDVTGAIHIIKERQYSGGVTFQRNHVEFRGQCVELLEKKSGGCWERQKLEKEIRDSHCVEMHLNLKRAFAGNLRRIEVMRL